MALAMKQDLASNPTRICSLGAQAVVLEPQPIAYPVQQPRQFAGSVRWGMVIRQYGATSLVNFAYKQSPSTKLQVIGQSNNLFTCRFGVDITLGIMKLPAVVLVALTSLSALAEPPSGVWRTPDGSVLAQTDARRSVGGFGAWLVATPDEDWQEKWNTPSSVIPHFSEASIVGRGGKLSLLIFFANPQPDRTGNASVSCDIRVTRPDGSYSLNASDLSCMDGPLLGEPANLRLGAPAIVFVAEPQDQAGVWRVQVVVKDQIRGVHVPVQTTFTLAE